MREPVGLLDAEKLLAIVEIRAREIRDAACIVCHPVMLRGRGIGARGRKKPRRPVSRLYARQISWVWLGALPRKPSQERTTATDRNVLTSAYPVQIPQLLSIVISGKLGIRR